MFLRGVLITVRVQSSILTPERDFAGKPLEQ
jgi:hypothetical protein